jgi:cytochrome c peroxidase
LAFSSPERFDRGFDGQLLSRNTPSIQGLVGFVSSFSSIIEPSFDNQAKTLLFWDGRQNNLADMVLNPILNHKEMNLPDFETLEKKLSSLTYYPELFRKAYGEEKISKEKIALALECFIQCLDPRPMLNNNFTGSSSLTFHNFNQTDTVGFTEQEKYGRFLFHTKYNCATCHDPGGNGSYGTSGLTFNANPMFNIGLDANYADPGLAGITKRNSDRGVFKVPTLQNIALTAPYMHDGRFKTLGEVLDHYSENIQPHPQLSGQFINADGTVKQLNITTAQKQALIAFLNKLTTPDFISNPMYADPFLAN